MRARNYSLCSTLHGVGDDSGRIVGKAEGILLESALMASPPAGRKEWESSSRKHLV